MAYREFEEIGFSRRSLLRGGAFLGAGAAMAGLPLGATAFARDAAGQWQNVSALIDEYVPTGKLANMVATLGWNQAVPTVIARGRQSIGQPTNADVNSLYRIYSMTKPITGMAVMMLIDQGKIGLDQSLGEILPAFKNMQVQATPDGSITDTVPAVRPITIRQLLTHTSGLGYGIVQKGPIKDAYEEMGLIPGQVSRLPIPGMGRGKPIGSLELFADKLATLPLVYQPGSKWSYSVGLDLLGRVIEVASAMAFDEFLSKMIFEPAGMTSTYFTVPQADLPRLTTNYGVMAGTLIPIDPPSASIYSDKPAFPYGGAGLVSSPADYDRFLRMLLGYGKIDGTRVMSEQAVRMGTSNLLPDTAETEGTWVAGEGFGAGGRVGLGEKDGTYGWGGAAGTVAFVDMKRGLRAAIYTQYMPVDAYPIHDRFPKAVVADLMAMAAGA